MHIRCATTTCDSHMQSREGLPKGQEGLCSTRGLGKILHVMHGGMGVNGRSHTLGDGRREGGGFDSCGDIKHILEGQGQ